MQCGKDFTICNVFCQDTLADTTTAPALVTAIDKEMMTTALLTPWFTFSLLLQRQSLSLSSESPARLGFTEYDPCQPVRKRKERKKAYVTVATKSYILTFHVMMFAGDAKNYGNWGEIANQDASRRHQSLGI